MHREINMVLVRCKKVRCRIIGQSNNNNNNNSNKRRLLQCKWIIIKAIRNSLIKIEFLRIFIKMKSLVKVLVIFFFNFIVFFFLKKKK